MQGRSCFNPQQRNIPTMTRNLEPKSAEPHHRTQSNGAFGGTIRQVQGPRVFGIALPSADIYREATDRTAGSVQALTRRSKTRPGKPFDLVDLQAAIAWSARYPVRLLFSSDHEALPEAIEVSVWGDRGVPRWLVWRDLTGRLVLDALAEREYGLLFADMADALGFIAGQVGGRLIPSYDPSTPAKA